MVNFLGVNKQERGAKAPQSFRGIKMAKKKQGYNARLDERLGMTAGKKSTKKMSMAGRRKVSKGARKPKGSFGFAKKK